LKEWTAARDLTDGQIIAAAEAWKARNSARFERIKIADAVDAFIKAKGKAGKQGERTYRAKLEPLKTAFPDQFLDAISARALTGYLEGYADGVTRNDHRKRAVALWRWAFKNSHLPAGVPLEIEQTDRAKEQKTEIGIIDPPTFRRLLKHFREQYPEHLAALVLAGFCGIRADEIHGKRADRSKRQAWEHVYMDTKKPYLQVSNAKENTPSMRAVPLCPAAVEWLMLCGDRKGPVCEAGAMEKVRLLARAAKFSLPENCFRHSFITYRIDATKNKAQVALEAGNSEKEITSRYKAKLAPGMGRAWFSITPGKAAETDGKEIKFA
jgi:integrase